MPFGFLPDQLRTMAELVPDEVGYTNAGLEPDHPGAHLTFRAWEARSNQLARRMVEGLQVAKGDRVAIHVPPEHPLEWLVAYSAVHKAGGVAVPIGTRLVARELAYLLGHAGAVVAVTGGSAAPVLAEARSDLPALRTVLEVDRPPWAEALSGDDSAFQVPLDRDDMADVMYTSGTTGLPKGVVVRHRGIAMVPNGTPRWTGDGWLHASPMFTFAGIASTYNPMKLGMRGLYLPRFDVDRWIDVVERERPTTVFLVPAMAELLLAHPRTEEADLSSIVMCSLGSAPIAPDTLARLRARLAPATVSNAWGMTEAGPAFCFMPPEEVERRAGSVGKPMAPTEFRVVDPDSGDDLAADTVGELLVRNPGREREYFNDPEATARSWQDGWLHTGDLARLDADGFLYIVGRQKDVIIRGGNNVHAADVEAVLYEHPAVQEAAVAGVAHPVLGEDIGAWVVLRPGHDLDDVQLTAFCAERLSDYKVPRRVQFLTELPRNPTGKVVKQALPGRTPSGP